MTMALTEKINRPPNEISENDLIEWEACAMSPSYFLSKYAWVQNFTQQTTERWQPWPYLLDLLAVFRDHKEVIICKARQLGISWLVMGYALWIIIFHANSKVLVFSQGEKEAQGMIAKCKFIWVHLPDFLRLSTDHDSLSGFDFPANGSKIEANSSSPNAGAGTDTTLVIRDELDLHPYAEANFRAVGPTVDAGGQLIELSANYKEGRNTFFMQRYRKAKAGENRAFPVFLGWRLRPIREPGMTLDQWWEEVPKKKYSPFELECIHPETEAQFLSDPVTRSYFPIQSLDEMLLDTHEPLPMPDLNTRGGMLMVYKPKQIGKRYVMFTDPSNGIEDPSATIVMDLATGEEQACFHGKVTADVGAQIHDELVRYYNNAFNSFENNAQAGGAFAETLKMLGTPNQSASINIDGKIKLDKNGSVIRYGQYTTPALKGRLLLPDLEKAIRTKAITVHTRETIEEFKKLTQWEGKPEPSVARGDHDDLIMAWAGVVHIAKYVPKSTGVVSTFRPNIRR